MTNQGELVNRILKGRYGHEKEYLVSVDREITEQFLNRMRKGVKILDTVTRPCTVEKTGEKSFRIILTQGLNRQIRRMCEALGYRVRTLKKSEDYEPSSGRPEDRRVQGDYQGRVEGVDRASGRKRRAEKSGPEKCRNTVNRDRESRKRREIGCQGPARGIE